MRKAKDKYEYGMHAATLFVKLDILIISLQISGAGGIASFRSTYH